MFLLEARGISSAAAEETMFGFFIGIACLIGLFATLRHHYGFGYGYGGWHHHGRHSLGYGHPPWGWRHGPRRFAMRKLFEHLDTTPGQEKVIVKSVETFTEHMINGREELRDVRKQVAQALGGDELDEQVLTQALERVEGMIGKAKADLKSALQEIHASLDGPQRQRLAEMIAEGPYARRRYRY
jgi:hypothetical protein